MRTRLMIATATAAALLGGAAFAQSASVNPPASNQLPAGVATGNAAVNEPTPSGQAGTGDVTAPSGSASGAVNSTGSLNSGSSSASSSDAANVAPAAGAPTERAPSATAGTDLISNGPVPDTPANRAKYGQPMSHAGRMTKAAGN
jgi:hypothetical protein